MTSPGSKTKRVWQIIQLWPKEATVTPHAANPGARKVLIKERILGLFRKETPAPAPEANPPSTSDLLADSELWDGWYKIRSAFDQACFEIGDSDATDKPARLLRAAQEFAAALEAKFGALTEAATFMKDLDARVGAFGTQSVEKEVWDHTAFSEMLNTFEKDHKAPGRTADPPAPGGETMKLSDIVAALSAMNATEQAQFAKELPEAIKAEIAKLTPAVSAPVRKEMMVECPGCKKKFDAGANMAKEPISLESLPVEVQAMLKEGADTKARMVKLEKEALLKECTETARGMKVGDVEKVAGMLVKVRSGEAIALEELNSVLSGAAAAVAEADKILTSERGLGRPATAGSAEGKLTALANEHRKANPKLTKEVALDMAMAEHPDLAEKFNDESRVAAQ